MIHGLMSIPTLGRLAVVSDVSGRATVPVVAQSRFVLVSAQAGAGFVFDFDAVSAAIAPLVRTISVARARAVFFTLVLRFR